MRTKKEQMSNTGKLFAIRGIAVVFAMVVMFALILLLGVYDVDTINFGSTVLAASDEGGSGPDEVQTFFPDTNTIPSAASIGYPGASGTTVFNTPTNITTSTVSFSNMSVYTTGWNRSDTPVPPTASPGTNAGQLQISLTSAQCRYNQAVGVINFNPLEIEFLRKLIESDFISTVKITITGSYSATSNKHAGYIIGAYASPGRCANDYIGNLSTYTYVLVTDIENGPNGWSTGANINSTLTLKNNTTLTPYVAFAVYFNGNENQTGSTTLSNLSFSMSFTRRANSDYTNLTNASSVHVDDGISPQVESFDLKSSDLRTIPYRPSNTQGINVTDYISDDWPVFYDTSSTTGLDVSKLLNKATDKVGIGTTVQLNSYTSTPIFTWNNVNAYKRLTFDVADYFDYDNLGIPTKATYAIQAAGLDSIEVGDINNGTSGGIFSYASNTGDFKNTSVISSGGNDSKIRYIYVQSENEQGNPVFETVGYAYIIRGTDANFRNNAKIVIYFTKNCDINVKIIDSGSLRYTQKIKVRGIDTINAFAPGLDVSEKTIISSETYSLTKFTSAIWNYDSQLEFAPIDNSDALEDSLWYAPHVYYYELEKLGSGTTGRDPNGTFNGFTNKTLATLKTWLPFSVGDFSGFLYDFNRGQTLTGIYPNGRTTEDSFLKGNGFYHVRIHAVDLAGNYANYVDYYFKVDSEEATYSISMSYTFEGTQQFITTSNNGIWATSALLMQLEQTVVSLSGNTIIINDQEGDPHTIIIDSLSTANAVGINKIDGVAPSRNIIIGGITYYQVVENEIYISANFSATSSYVYNMYFCPDNDALLTYPVLDYQTTIEIANGQNYDEAEVIYYNSDWTDSSTNVDGIWIKVDRNNPTSPALEHEDGKILEVHSSELPTSEFDLGLKNDDDSVNLMARSWYTNGFSISYVSDFTDALQNTFTTDIRVYVAMSPITMSGNEYVGFKTLSQFTSITQAERNNISVYDNKIRAIFGDYFVKINGGAFDDDGLYPGTFNLRQTEGIGLRVFYVWAIDQAGNMSPIQNYFVLVDNTTYYVSSIFNQGNIDLFGTDVATISVQNEEGDTITSFKRGDTLNVVTDIDIGYVPYRILKKVGTTETIYGYNFESSNAMFDIDEEYISYVQYSSGIFSILADTNSIYTYFNTETTTNVENERVYFEVTYRKVISVYLTSVYERYKGTDALGNPLVKPAYIIDDESYSADEALSFTYYIDSNYTTKTDSENGGAITEGGTPLNIGAYFVEIATDSDYYVIQEKIRSNFTINAANLTIAVKSGVTAQYTQTDSFVWEDIININGLVGYDITLYNSIGIALFDVGIIGIKDLDGFDIDYTTESLNIGTYSIYAKEAFEYANYVITFTAGQMNVTPYGLIAEIIAEPATKIFDTTDAIYKFKVLKSSFDDAGIEWIEVFRATTVSVDDSDPDYYIFTPSSQWVMRIEGENVGIYNFLGDVSNFDIQSNNYTITIDLTSEPTLEILPRPIQITPISGQEGLEEVGNIAYSYSSADAKYVTSQYITGALALSTTYSEDISSNPYFKIRTYTIEQGTLASIDGNITINFTTGKQYILKIQKEGVEITIVTVSQTAPIEFTYGKGNPSSAYEFAAAKESGIFEFANLPENWRIEYTITYCPTSIDSVGEYKLGFGGNIRVIDDLDNEQSTYQVVFDNIIIRIVPQPIFITPVVSGTTRQYGLVDDGLISISYTAKDDEDNDASSMITAGGLIRGIYRKSDGALLALGGRYDSASDANGEFLYYGIEAYYGIAIGTSFEFANSNYTVSFTPEYYSQRFTITPRDIILNPEDDFYGISKDYDGTSNAIYGENDISVFISNKIAKLDEDVKVDFIALYDSPDIGDSKTITFSNLALVGDAAVNYVLKIIDETSGLPVAYVNQTVTIEKLIPTIPAGDGNKIQIHSVTIQLSKADFVISKEYDGTTEMNNSSVAIDEHCALSNFTMSVTQSAFPDSAVSSAYSTEVTLLFTYEVTEAVNINFEDQEDKDIVVNDNGNGSIIVTLKNMPVSITKKTLTVDDIESIIGIDRPYDTSSFVDVIVAIKDSALALGDTSEDAGLSVVAHAAKVSTTNPGTFDRSAIYNGVTYYFTFVKDVAEAQNVGIYIESIISNYATNYVTIMPEEDLAVACAKNYNSARVTISKAELELALSIKTASYSGIAKLATGALTKSTQITSSIQSDLIVKSQYDYRFITELYNELANITYNFDTLDAYYTKNGKLYPYVNLDSEGILLKHAVSFANIILEKNPTSSLTDDEINTILANYTFFGTFYTVSEEGTVAAATEKQALALGSIVANDAYSATGESIGYESSVLATLNKMRLQIKTASVSLPSKVYDGTNAGLATIPDPTSIGIAASDAENITISLEAFFSQKDAGENIRVDVTNVTLTNKDPNSEINYVSNYIVENTAVYGNRKIYKSYAIIDFDLASKVYDGTNSVAKNSIKPEITVPILADNGLYNVNYSFAFLGGKDVSVPGVDESSDNAIIYGIKLVSSRTNINYDLYIKGETLPDELFDANGDLIESKLNEYKLANPSFSIEATKFYYSYTNREEKIAYYALDSVRVKTVRVNQWTGDAPVVGDIYSEGKFLGRYVDNAISYYAFETDDANEKTYAFVPITKKVAPFINPAALSFTVSPTGSGNIFQKTYDGTKEFNESFDVTYGLTLTPEEKATITNAIVGEYESANVGNTSVVFTISDPSVISNTNYSSVDVTFKVAARINVATINAFLKDADIPYGTMPADRVFDVQYSTDANFQHSETAYLTNSQGDGIDLEILDGKMGYYQLTSDGSAVDGKKYYTFEATWEEVPTGTATRPNRHYYERSGEPGSYIYTLVAVPDAIVGEYSYYLCTNIVWTETEFNQDVDNYEFIPLTGNMVTPTVSTSVTNNSSVRTKPYDAKLVGGSATNFAFNFVYTGTNSSSIRITKLTLYVYVMDTYTDPEGSTENYAARVVYSDSGTMPQFSLGYAAGPNTMLTGLVNGQTAADLKKNGQIAPKTKVKEFNGSEFLDGEVTTLNGKVVTRDLTNGAYYLIYIDLDDAVAINYTFVRKQGDALENCVKLLLVYPALTNYSVSDTVTTYNGNYQNVSVSGSGAVVSYMYYTDSSMTQIVDSRVKDAGEYFVKVTAEKQHTEGWVGYATFKIKKSTFKITVPAVTFDYDGYTHEAEFRISNNAVSESDISITYKKSGEDNETTSAPSDVGTYLVTATYTSPAERSTYAGGKYRSNYESTSSIGRVVIIGAYVTIIVNEKDKSQVLTKEDIAEGKTVALTYSVFVDEEDYDKLAAAGFDPDNYEEDIKNALDVLYSSTEETDLDIIEENGVYNYQISVDPSYNIILKGATTGSFIVGTNSISDESKYVIINSVGDTVLSSAVNLVYEKVIYQSNLDRNATQEQFIAANANNVLYQQIESNIPTLASKFYESVSLAGVLKVQMRQTTNGVSSLTQPNGKVKITTYAPVKLADDVKLYMVSQDGKLAPLSYTKSGSYITYETDYVNTIVFVKVGTFMDFLNNNWWLYIVAGAVVLVLLLAIILPSVLVARKKKKAKLAMQTAQTSSSAPAPEASVPVMEAAPVAEAPIPEPVVEEPIMEAPPIEEPPMEDPPMEDPPMEAPPVDEPPVAPAPEATAPKKAPPPGAVGQKPSPSAAPKKAPPPGAVGQKPSAPTPKKAPPPGAIGKK